MRARRADDTKIRRRNVFAPITKFWDARGTSFISGTLAHAVLGEIVADREKTVFRSDDRNERFCVYSRMRPV